MSSPNPWTAVRERDWAELVEQATLPLQGAALDAARVTHGTRMLDAGCGTGILSVLARLRGADVTAVDGSPAMLNIARERLPGCDVRQADLPSLPFPDGTFDAVVAVNSIFFTADMVATLRELVRVLRPAGRVVLTSWGPAERCDFTAVRRALAQLVAEPPRANGPSALAEPGAAEDLLRQAGLRLVDRGEAPCAQVYANLDLAWRAASSTGPTQAAIRARGEPAVRQALEEVARRFARADGTVRFQNVFVWAAGER